ncbi:uncharacterized protein LOC131028058 isoform X2 [Cryptomeria japonica]|uniref:uncharacterized protein LOC131028058 isoform X2 n=1 Tax=Cryptomeria japonica TaxID=3369 RepID=UPI0027DA0777|nr:uncharacterized protein LOC131028058 isoform X2 [Cryptomeria japonica]
MGSTDTKAIQPSGMAMEEEKDEKQANECCQKLKDKLRKAESGRQKLREAINILEKAVRKGQEEIECENEQKRADDASRRAGEEERERLELEKEHNSLKSEFASVSQRLNDIESKSKIDENRKDEHAKIMKANTDEIKKLQELLEKEQQTLQFEKKRLEGMKKQVNAEKKKAEDEKKHADIARKKAEEERKCAGVERKKFEEEKKRADAERKRAEDEKTRRETLEKNFQQLELEKISAEKVRRCNEEKTNAADLLQNAVKKSKEEKILKEQLKKEQRQLKGERKRGEKQKKQIELLEKECSMLKEQLEKKQHCLNTELKRAEEGKKQRQTIEGEYSVLKEEMGSALARNSDRKNLKREKLLDELLKKEQQELNSERKRAEEQKRQIEALEKGHFLLKQQFEMSEMKRAEEDKRQREALERECSVLKEELANILGCLKSHDGQLKDTRRELQQLQMEVHPVDGSSISKRAFPKSKMVAKATAIESNRSASFLIEDDIQRNGGLNRRSMLKCSLDAGLSVSGGNFTETIPSIHSAMEPSIGVCVEKPMQSSVVHSTVASFSDQQLVELQGRGACVTSNSLKGRKHKKKQELVVAPESPAVTEKACTHVLPLPEGSRIHKHVMDGNGKIYFTGKQGNTLSEIPKCAAETTIHGEIDGTLEEKKSFGRKRKSEPENIADSIMDLFHKEKRMHLMIEEKLESLREALRVKQDKSVDIQSLKLRAVKSKRKRKRDNTTKSSNEENADSRDHKTDEYKATHNVKEDCSGNFGQLHMPSQGNEVEDDENEKEQLGVKEMLKLIECSHGGVAETSVEANSHLVERSLNEQMDIMGSECTIDFDLKRMLQLDNEFDEELYIKAKECLLSPTLPELPSPCLEELEGGKFFPSVEENPFKSIELLPIRDSCTNVLGNENNARKTPQFQKGFSEESVLQSKQDLSSVSWPEKTSDEIELLDGHCTDLLCEEAPSELTATFISGDWGIEEFQMNNTITNKSFLASCGNPNNNLPIDVIRKDDEIGNINENKHELCRKEIDQQYVKSKFSQNHARGAVNIESRRVKDNNDFPIRKCTRKSDMVDLKSLQSSFNKQIKISSMENGKEYGTESDTRDDNDVVGCNIKEIKQLILDEDERHGSFTEIVPMHQVLYQKCENPSCQQGADDDEIARISNDSHVNNFLMRGSCIFSVDNADSNTMQARGEKLASTQGIFGSSLTQGSVLYVDQVNETAVTFEDRKQKRSLESCQEQIKPSKTCEDEEKRCPSVFRIVSSNDEENVSYSLFKSTDSLWVIFDASSGVPDLERLVLTIDSVTKLTKEETVSICVSALVSKLASLMANSKARRVCDSDPTSFLWSKNLMDQINKVSSSDATKDAFSKVFVIDILVSLLTKFLVEGEVMVYTDSADYSGTLMEAEHGQFSVLRHIATIAELEAGSYILASFCLALGNINCLYEVMYMVLRWCKQDSIWLLTVVHSITLLCWKHCLQFSRSNVLGNTICAIILLLEGHEKGVPQSLLNHSDIVSSQKQTHPLSMHCPFAEDVPSMDANISFLLETLNQFPVSNKKGEQTPTKVLDCEISDFIYNVERKVESQKMNYCQQDGSAALNNLQDVSKHRDHLQNKKADSSCYLSVLNDTVLALELVAQYLGWDWTYNELIPHFWRMAQPNAPDMLIMTIFLLVGIIGRFGIDYNGFEQHGVEELRQNLSTLLDLHCMTEGRHIFSFSCQLAAAQSLFELLGNMKMPRENQIESAERIVGREAIHSTHLKILNKWYSNLNAEQQSMLPEYMRVYIGPLRK